MMICAKYGRTGIRWMGPFSNLPHTECPPCGCIDCQEADSGDGDEADVEGDDQ